MINGVYADLSFFSQNSNHALYSLWFHVLGMPDFSTDFHSSLVKLVLVQRWTFSYGCLWVLKDLGPQDLNRFVRRPTKKCSTNQIPVRLNPPVFQTCHKIVLLSHNKKNCSSKQNEVEAYVFYVATGFGIKFNVYFK